MTQDTDLIGALADGTAVQLRAMLEPSLSGYFLGDDCGDKCIVHSSGSPFGSINYAEPAATTTAGAAPASNLGRKLLQDAVEAGGTAGAPATVQRGIWVYYYRYEQGVHLWPIGLEMLVDTTSYDPADWSVARVWWADMMFPSADVLLAAYNGTGLLKGANVTEKLRAYKPVLPGELLSCYLPEVWPKGRVLHLLVCFLDLATPTDCQSLDVLLLCLVCRSLSVLVSFEVMRSDFDMSTVAILL